MKSFRVKHKIGQVLMGRGVIPNSGFNEPSICGTTELNRRGEEGQTEVCWRD